MNPYKTNPPEGSVGIVIPMRDNLKFFKLAFHSVLNFTDYPYMLTIIDNMSQFTTKTYLRSIQKNHQINILSYQSDFNFAAECNLGLKYLFANPQVKYGLILNSDVVVEPQWLSRMIQVLTSSDKCGIVGPVSNVAIPAQERRRFMSVAVTPYVSGFCMAFRRDVFERLGGFDENYIGGCYEDRDFCYRAAKEGWKSVVAGPVYIHHFWKITRGQDPKADAQAIANKERFNNKFPEGQHVLEVI